MRLKTTIVALALAVSLAGCGSQSYSDRAHSAVDQLQSATQSYNQNASNSLSAQGAACSDAAGKLGTKSPPFLSGSVPARYRREAAALAPAYRLTRRGLADCATAARTLNYPLMVTAMNELAQANVYIKQARRLDR